MKYVPKPVPEGVNVAPTNVLAELATLLCVLALLAVGAFHALGWAAEALALRMSPELEARVGAHLGAQLGIGRMPSPPPDGPEQAVLDRLVSSLPGDRLPLRLGLACEEAAVNAVAVPGGHVVVLRGLLDALRSENELAFVLAHEVGHFVHRDHLRALGRGLVWVTLATLVGGQGGAASAVIHDSGLLASSRFSQRQELAADAFAAELVVRTYGHAGGVTDFFRNPVLQDGGGWLATHPASRRRARALDRLIAERGWPTGALVPYRSAACPCAGEGPGGG